MKRSLRLSRLIPAILASACLLLVSAGVATATPSLTGPANGERISSASQVFTWTDNYNYGPLDHWYLEISTDPLVDSWGFF